MSRSIHAPLPSIILIGVVVFLNFQFSVAHVYIKSWKSTSENEFQLAQKQPASETAYRDASTNIGWIGSDFLSGDRAIVCGASETPFAKVASPGGKYFADASEAVGKTLTVEAGGKITLVTAGDPGKGFPHPKGTIQAYLGYCGQSNTACQAFDATKASYFKIQEVKNAVQDKLLPAMNYDLGGNVWEVPIPGEVPQGSYIFRFEIIAFNQSDTAEGLQDQYYPSCGQLYVKSSHGVDSLNSIETVKFPGAYKNGNIPQASAPGPAVMQLATRAETSQSKEAKKAVKSTSDKTLKTKAVDTGAATDTDTESSSESPSNSTSSESENSDEICSSKLIPSCAKMCLAVKHKEVGSLAPDCAVTDGKCLCSQKNFVQAYKNCAKDNCPSEPEFKSAVNLFTSQCDRLTKKRDLGTHKMSLRRHRRFRSTSTVTKAGH
ncbi:hypothetical protein CROQUDRAFT_668232 [Cronartium quercuum f. sp. fusiforme G11]|uniref:lytic cellulose monooxygenase (C4-dehydrogenating) n=1 Tax=Cronartium quercuum f. sp. fusiforme G11 TaxID=708437 RepID=A0A9P6NSM3_9BASI|nr:hypothetical protein CROQUDRAFT_668232 [Cronartium quercuum f. sp. fusiforme G11]